MDSKYLSDVYLLDFYERSCEENIIWYNTSIIKLISQNEKDTSWIIASINRNVKSILYQIPLVYDILLIGDGKISLCGISADNIFFCKECKFQFSLYIHSCCTEEANILIRSCLQRTFREWDTLVYYSKDTNYVIINCNDVSIVIYLEIYKDRNQILINNGPITERCGYDVEVGFFTTSSYLSTLLREFVPLDYDEAENFSIEPLEDIPYAIHDINKDVTEQTKLSYILYSFGGLLQGVMSCVKIEDINISLKYIPNSIISSLEVDNVSTKPYIPMKYPKPDLEQYLPNYKQMTIGISNDRYLAFVTSIPRLNKDIIRLLCNSWLKEEYLLAKRRLCL